MQRTIAIIGGGPAGAALGLLLARQGYKTAIFHTGKRPPLIVGESLIPADIPFLRKLGVEQQIKAFSTFKPGATICLGPSEVITAPFTYARGKLPSYAYNCPRDLFDEAILAAAQRAGAVVFRIAAKLEKGELPDTVRLSQQTLEGAGGFFDGQPELIVDATGRNRLIPRLLGHRAVEGGRNDVALFAHLHNVAITDAGNIHLDFLAKGWSWRVPLPGKISLGVVINPSHLKKYGSGIEKQYDAYIQDEPSLKVYCQGAKRLTPVMKYDNYQLISPKMYGPGWMLVGDSAGFVDPVFSSGLYLGLKSAFEACEVIKANSALALKRYQTRRRQEFKWWQQVIESWYGGTLFNLYRAAQKFNRSAFGAALEIHVRARLARVLTGEATGDRGTMRIFESLMSFGKVLRNPRDLVVQ